MIKNDAQCKQRQPTLRELLFVFAGLQLHTYVPLPDMAMCETYIHCSYHIYIGHRNLKIRKTRNNFSVQVRNFLLPLSLKVLRHKERDTHSFYPGFFICPPTLHLVWPLPKASVSKRKSTVFSQGRSRLNSLTFSKSSARFRCVTSFALASPVSHLGYFDISEWHARFARAREHLC